MHARAHTHTQTHTHTLYIFIHICTHTHLKHKTWFWQKTLYYWNKKDKNSSSLCLVQGCSEKKGVITWLFARILIWPVTAASGPWWTGFSMLTFASASSPNIERAYRLAAIKPQYPERAWGEMCDKFNMLLENYTQANSNT